MPFRVLVITEQARRVNADAMIVPYRKDLPAEVMAALKTRDFTGAWGKAEFLLSPRGYLAQFLAVAGLGEEKKIAAQLEGMRRAVGCVVQDMRAHVLRELAVDLREASHSAAWAAAAVEAVGMADYAFTDYKKSLLKTRQARSLKSLTILVDEKEVGAVRSSIRAAQQVMEGVTLARNLTNQPASHMKPKTLADTARAIAEKDDAILVKVMNRQQAEKDGWRAFLAVAGGSAEEPYVIHLTYRPKEAANKKVVLVGKGITFDSGGLSLKPANAMEDMKIDMAGAATVLGVFSVLERVKPNVEVHGVIAACENMPSGMAYRPGDVIESRSGKTIEILNTDAEGRVTLADALDYACGLKPDAVIDLATLTGACMVALGETYSGLFSNNRELNDELLTAAKMAGEGLDDLPLPEEYKQHIDSKVADVSNAPANNPLGGAITAALFLQEFVPDKTPWAHIDIAGPSYMNKQLISYWAPGGTGWGVRTLIEFLKSFA